MSDDERFERELRAGLRDLASEPAPERLVRRIVDIPGRAETFDRRRSIGSFVAAIAAAAAIVLVAGALILSRPTPDSSGVQQPTAGPPSPTPASTATAIPSAASASVPTPDVSASAATSSSAAAPASTVPATSPTPAPSVSPTGRPVPAGFQPVSVTFVSANEGWVLGSTPCNAPPCTAILHTADGGRTWAVGHAPAAPISGPDPGVTSGLALGSGVSGLRFADPLDGWAFGPDLWATHDGGATWRQVAIPGPPSPIVALETSRGTVHAVLFETVDQPAVLVASSPIKSDGWNVSPIQVQIGAGPVPRSQLVLSGTTGWLLQVDRSVVGGARLVGGAWQTWPPVCADVAGPALLAASTETDLVAACDVGEWSTPQGEHLYASRDAGHSFAEAGTPIPLTGVSAMASPAAGTVVVAGSTASGSRILRSSDDGKTWRTALDVGQDGVSYLGFTTTTQGVAITSSGGGSGTGITGGLFMTRDGGQTWSKVAFAEK